MNHTPTPWQTEQREFMGAGFKAWKILDDFDEEIAVSTLCDDEISKANAEFIVLAVNSHKKLVDSLSAILKMIENGKLVRDVSQDNEFKSFLDQSVELITNLTNANLAIAEAEDNS